MSIVKKVFYSGIILVLIVAMILVSSFLENSKEKKRFAAFYPQFEQQVGKIVLTQNEMTAILTKENGLWFVSNGINPEIKYPADSVKVLSVVNKIAEMKKDNYVGANKENFAQYGFEDDSTFFVQIFDSRHNKIGDFFLGKKSENWRFNYFRKVGDNAVYLVGGGIGYAFKSDVNEWRIRKLFNFNPENITQITAQYDGQNIIILKDSTAWIFSDSTSVNSDEVTNLIKEFAELDAGDWDYSYSISDEISGLDNPSAQYTLTLKDGQKHSLIVGNMDGERPRFFVKYDDNPQIAFVFRSVISRLKLQPSVDFRF
jgi:hypothetical protein